MLAYGIGWLDLDIGWPQVLTLLGTVLISQFIFTKTAGLPGYDPRSALISGLSLCLRLRTNNPRLLIAAGTVTIASKFISVGAANIFSIRPTSASRSRWR